MRVGTRRRQQTMNTSESWKQWRKDYSRYMAPPQTQSNPVYSDSWERIATDSITGSGESEKLLRH